MGAQKAGTTALYYHLMRHPQIFMSAVKEPQFFSYEEQSLRATGPGDSRSNPIRSLDDYRALFAGAADFGAAGEASVGYLYSAVAAQRIREHLPDVRLIAILRNPVDRAYSNYMHLVRDGREPMLDFRLALEAEPERKALGWSVNWRYFEKGLYGHQIERYLRCFPDSQVRFLLYEDFNARPGDTMREIFSYIGVCDDVHQDYGTRINVGGVPRSGRLQALTKHSDRIKWRVDRFLPTPLVNVALSLQNRNLSRPELPGSLRAELVERYADDISRVGALTGLSVSDWYRTGEPCDD